VVKTEDGFTCMKQYEAGEAGIDTETRKTVADGYAWCVVVVLTPRNIKVTVTVTATSSAALGY